MAMPVVGPGSWLSPSTLDTSQDGVRRPPAAWTSEVLWKSLRGSAKRAHSILVLCRGKWTEWLFRLEMTQLCCFPQRFCVENMVLWSAVGLHAHTLWISLLCLPLRNDCKMVVLFVSKLCLYHLCLARRALLESDSVHFASCMTWLRLRCLRLLCLGSLVCSSCH